MFCVVLRTVEGQGKEEFQDILSMLFQALQEGDGKPIFGIALT